MDGQVLKGLEAEIQPGTRAGSDPAPGPVRSLGGSCLLSPTQSGNCCVLMLRISRYVGTPMC